MIASILVISSLCAWSEVSGTYIGGALVFLYVIAIIIAPIIYTVLNLRKRMKEVRDYLKNIKSGALERLTGSDITKVLEKDEEYIRELTKFSKKQFRSILILFGLLGLAFIIYVFGLSHAVNSLVKILKHSIENPFQISFIKYIIYFTILFTIVYGVTRVLRLGFFTPAEFTSSLPYTPTRSIVVFKDALILDDIYLLKAPIQVKQVIINEKRKFIELELTDDYRKILPSQKVRIYIRNPREFWEQLLSKLVKVISS